MAGLLFSLLQVKESLKKKEKKDHFKVEKLHRGALSTKRYPSSTVSIHIIFLHYCVTYNDGIYNDDFFYISKITINLQISYFNYQLIYSYPNYIQRQPTTT